MIDPEGPVTAPTCTVTRLVDQKSGISNLDPGPLLQLSYASVFWTGDSWVLTLLLFFFSKRKSQISSHYFVKASSSFSNKSWVQLKTWFRGRWESWNPAAPPPTHVPNNRTNCWKVPNYSSCWFLWLGLKDSSGNTCFLPPQAGMIPGTRVQMDLSDAFIFTIFTEDIYVSGSMLSTDHRLQGFQISWKALKIQNLQPDPRLPSGGSQKPIFFIKLSKWVMHSQNGSHNLMPSRPLELISPHSELGFPLCPWYLCILPDFFVNPYLPSARVYGNKHEASQEYSFLLVHLGVPTVPSHVSTSMASIVTRAWTELGLGISSSLLGQWD